MFVPVSPAINVLHVDDEPDFADMAADFLERENERLSVETAVSASDGLARLEKDDFDCVVSDYEMPDESGIDLLNTVRTDQPDLPFILFTGKGSEEVASEAISAGVTDYLQKEAGTDQYQVLANRITNVVDKHRAEKLVNRAFQAMNQSRDGIALLDENGKFVYVNEAYTEVVGYDQAELIGEFWELVYPDEQANRILEYILAEVPEEGHWAGDSVYARKDGSRVRVEHTLTYSEEGTMICLIRDLSGTDFNDEALHKERQRFDLFVNAVNDYAIFMLDPDGYIITWNAGAARIKGYTEDEMLGEHFSTFYTEDQRDEDLPERLLIQALEEGSVEHQGPRVHKDGTTFQADVVITALNDEKGRHRGFGKVTRDISESSN